MEGRRSTPPSFVITTALDCKVLWAPPVIDDCHGLPVYHSPISESQERAPALPAGLFFPGRPRSTAAMRATDRNASKKAAERRFPHRVDVLVPGGGLGRRLTDMLDWCRANVAAGAWDEHGHSERRKGEAPRDFARFHFMDEAAAAEFTIRFPLADDQG